MAQTICLYWDMKLDYMASLVVILFILILILLAVYIGTRYARKIMPVNALRNITRNKKQKHNHFSLDKFNFNVNLLLSLKSIVNNLKEINKKLPIYKNIQEIVFRYTEFPKNSSLKIKRY